MDGRRPKRGDEQLAPTWWAYCLRKFIRENGLSKGGLADRIGKDGGTISRWLYEGIIPPTGTQRLIERTWHRDGWFAQHRPEGVQWALQRLEHSTARQRFHEAAQHSPTMWMELDDVLQEAGIPTFPQYPLPYETACELLAQAEAQLERESDTEVRERLEMEIAAWKLAYGCD